MAFIAVLTEIGSSAWEVPQRRLWNGENQTQAFRGIHWFSRILKRILLPVTFREDRKSQAANLDTGQR